MRRDAAWAASGRRRRSGRRSAVLRAWIEQYGIPQALYTDWKNVYVRRPNQEERETGAEPLTQFGRMCAALGIKIIPASSPQAKGRIERNHGTHQDRLVKKLRRQGIADVDGGERVSRRRVLGRPQSAICPAAGLGGRLPRGRPARACGWTRCSGSRRHGRSRTTGSCAMTIGCCSSSGRAVGRRRAARCWSRGRRRAARDSLSGPRDALDGDSRPRPRRRPRRCPATGRRARPAPAAATGRGVGRVPIIRGAARSTSSEIDQQLAADRHA